VSEEIIKECKNRQYIQIISVFVDGGNIFANIESNIRPDEPAHSRVTGGSSKVENSRK
jgi:hypothetical protein